MSHKKRYRAVAYLLLAVASSIVACAQYEVYAHPSTQGCTIVTNPGVPFACNVGAIAVSALFVIVALVALVMLAREMHRSRRGQDNMRHGGDWDS